jgi:hypothetical protein
LPLGQVFLSVHSKEARLASFEPLVWHGAVAAYFQTGRVQEAFRLVDFMRTVNLVDGGDDGYVEMAQRCREEGDWTALLYYSYSPRGRHTNRRAGEDYL